LEADSWDERKGKFQVAGLPAHHTVFPEKDAGARGLGGERPDQQRDLAGILETRFEQDHVLGVEREALARMAAKEARHGHFAARRVPGDDLVKPPEIGIREPVERAAAVVAENQLVVFDGNDDWFSRRGFAEQHAANLRTARVERAESLHDFAFETVDHGEGDAHDEWFLRNFPSIGGRCGRLQLEAFCACGRLHNRWSSSGPG